MAQLVSKCSRTEVDFHESILQKELDFTLSFKVQEPLDVSLKQSDQLVLEKLQMWEKSRFLEGNSDSRSSRNNDSSDFLQESSVMNSSEHLQNSFAPRSQYNYKNAEVRANRSELFQPKN